MSCKKSLEFIKFDDMNLNDLFTIEQAYREDPIVVALARKAFKNEQAAIDSMQSTIDDLERQVADAEDERDDYESERDDLSSLVRDIENKLELAQKKRTRKEIVPIIEEMLKDIKDY